MQHDAHAYAEQKTGRVARRGSSDLERRVANADGRPFDEPPSGEVIALAREATRHAAAEGTFEAQLTAANARRMVGDYSRGADELFQAAIAQAPYDRVLAARSDYALFLKLAGRFSECLAELLDLVQRDAMPEKRLLVNAVIAAIGTGNGPVAAQLLSRIGIPAESRGALPLVPGIPAAQVRVLSESCTSHSVATGPGTKPALLFERLWVQPLSPFHGVIVSPAFQHSMVDIDDLVLWDGAPAAVITRGGDTVPVFPILAVLRRSDAVRLELALEPFADTAAVQALCERLGSDVVFEDQAAAITSACRAHGALTAQLSTIGQGTHHLGGRALARAKVVVPANQDARAIRAAMVGLRGVRVL